jgi:hypothetical protein
MAFNNTNRTSKQQKHRNFEISSQHFPIRDVISLGKTFFCCNIQTLFLRFNVTAVLTELMSWKQEHELYLPWLFDSSAVYLDREYIPVLFHRIVLYWCKLFDHLHDVVMNLLVILNDIWILHSKICKKKRRMSI